MPYSFVEGLGLCQGITTVQLIVIIVGEGLWIITYLLIILRAFRDRSYGVPITAIALNYTWELLACFIFPSSCWIVRLLRYGWLILDTVIVWQLFGYGRKEQRVPDLRQHFFICVTLIFVLAAVGHWTFHDAFGDKEGVVAAFSINLVMSVLFVALFYARGDGHGLSYGASWTKMLGTGILSVASAIEIISHPNPIGYFMLFLFANIFCFDFLYIFLLHRFRNPITAAS